MHLYDSIDTGVKINKSNDVSSLPYQLCFCESTLVYNCSEVKSFKIHRGQEFRVFLLALNQVQSPVATLVRAVTSPSASLKLNQNLQHFLSHCHDHVYNLHSTESHEELVLFPADGPCRDTGLARAVINVTLYPCPHAFIQSGKQCNM